MDFSYVFACIVISAASQLYCFMFLQLYCYFQKKVVRQPPYGKFLRRSG